MPTDSLHFAARVGHDAIAGLHHAHEVIENVPAAIFPGLG
jgi:hypothetical protein